MADSDFAPVKVQTIPEERRNPCSQGNHMSTIVGNKQYIVGGYDVIGGATMLSSSYIRIYTLNDSSIPAEVIRLPDDFPRRKYGSLWGDEDSGAIFLYGGPREVYPIQLNESSPGIFSPRQPYEENGRLVYRFDLAKKTWRKLRPRGEIDSGLRRPQAAVDPKRRRAFAYGGTLDDGTYLLPNGTLLGESIPSMPKRTLVSFDLNSVKDRTIKAENRTTDFAPMGSVEGGQMVYLDLNATEKAREGEGVLVLFGGSQGGGNLPMESIYVYDIASTTWYTQKATAEDGNFPEGREGFCAVSVTAADGSSHSIYITGGIRQGSNAALEGIWVLTLPAFHWIRVGDTRLPKIQATCDLVKGKYMWIYGGRQREDDYLICDTQLEERTQAFDLSQLEWVDSVAAKDDNATVGYKVPKNIYSIIGGGPDGSATFLEPKSGWVSEQLKALFPANKNNGTSPAPNTSPPEKEGMSKGATAGVVIGAILGCAIILALIFILFRRRRRRRSQPENNFDPLPMLSSDVKSTTREYYPPEHKPLPTASPFSPTYELAGSRDIQELDSSQSRQELQGSTFGTELDSTEALPSRSGLSGMDTKERNPQ